MIVIHYDLIALDLVAIHGSHASQEGGVLIELKLGRICTRTTRRARLSENGSDDFTALDRANQDTAEAWPNRLRFCRRADLVVPRFNGFQALSHCCHSFQARRFFLNDS
jgi:hypothetical protein